MPLESIQLNAKNKDQSQPTERNKVMTKTCDSLSFVRASTTLP